MAVGEEPTKKTPLASSPTPNPSSSFPHFLFLPSSLSFNTPQTYLQIDLGAWGRGEAARTHAPPNEFRQWETCVEGERGELEGLS